MPEETIVESAPEAGFPDGVSNERPLTVTPEANIEQPEIPAEKIEGKYDELLSKVSGSQTVKTTTADDIHLDAKSIGETMDEESKIQKLLDLAETKGVVHAVKVARSLKDYYALDKMHDDLADKLYDGLVEKGMLEGK